MLAVVITDDHAVPILEMIAPAAVARLSFVGISVALRWDHRCHELTVDSTSLNTAARIAFAAHPPHAVLAIFRGLPVASEQSILFELALTVAEAPASGLLERSAGFPQAGGAVLARLAVVACSAVPLVDHLSVRQAAAIRGHRSCA